MSGQRYFKYFSFISYSRKDEVFAKRLQRFLTDFKLPIRLCRQYPDKPRNLRPVCPDKRDFGSDARNQGVPDGLSLSRYLIVICSEHAARPGSDGRNTVEAEVRAFLEADAENKNYVIPVLLRKKNGPSSRECTPVAVQELNLLAADVSDKGEARVFNDVAAKMLGLEPDELWNWWERIQRFRRRCRWAAGAVAAILSGCAAWAAWDYFVPHHTYYMDYVECDNLPQGIHPLMQEETKLLHSYYCFTTQYHRLRRVENCKAGGKPVEVPNLPGQEGRPVSMSFRYDAESGKVTKQIYCNAARQPVQIRLVGNASISFWRPGKNSGACCASFSLAPGVVIDAANCHVGRLNVQRENGFITVEQYKCVYNKEPVQNEAGVCGCRYRRDAKGRVEEISYVDDSLKCIPDNTGVAHVRYAYADKGNKAEDAGPVKRVSYHDAAGNLVCCSGGYAIAEYEHDVHGNQTSCTLYDRDGKKITEK